MANSRMQRVMMRVLAVMLVVSFLLAVTSLMWPRPTRASGCSAWQNTGSCCDISWWPGEQDYQWRKCVGGNYEWYEYRCAAFTQCP